jgi:hypothetical protein
MGKIIALLVVWIGCAGDKGPTGDPGQDGTPGKNTLVRLDDEAPGTHCPLGGTAIRTGVDTNNDGTLEDDEITGTTYVCSQGPVSGAVLEGDYVAQNSYELAIIADVTKITGSLAIQANTSVTAYSHVDLNALSIVGGAFTLIGTHIPTLSGSFASLTHFPAGVIDLESNAFTGALVLPSGPLYGLQIIGNPITSLDVSAMDVTNLTDVHINFNDSMTTITGLHAATGSGFGSFVFEADYALTALDLHSLVTTDSLIIHLESALADLDLSSLDYVHTRLEIVGNGNGGLLKQCVLDAIVAGLSTLPSMPIQIQTGNSDPCT